MLVAEWSDDGVRVGEREVPGSPPEGWVRLRVTSCGICGSDLHILRGMRAGALRPAEFATPGHEIAGRLEVGETGMADVVYAVEPWVSCRSCVHCAQGHPVVCEQGQLLGVSVGGGLAELVDVPRWLVHPVDATLDPAVASLAEPWAVAVRAVHRARLTEVGERLLVLGGGTIGLLCGVAARDRVARVGITCRYPHQRDLAERFGLEPIDEADVDAWADEHRPGVVVETVGGEADTIGVAVRCARPGGRVIVVGVFGAPTPTDYRAVVLKELELVGSFIYGTVGRGSEFAAAVEAMAGIGPELTALQTHRFPLVDAAAAFEAAADKASQAIKVTVDVGAV